MIAKFGLATVFGTWAIMFALLRIRHVQYRRPTATRRPSSRVGILLQATAYALVFGVRSMSWRPFDGGWAMGVPAAVVVATALCACGAAIVIRAQQTLGVQWSLTARLVVGHRLVTGGPYAVVRHPIYAAMIVMLLGTGIALTSPLIVILALAIYVPGTLVRVRAEEALMREAFGARWEAYRCRVRALIPGVL